MPLEHGQEGVSLRLADRRENLVESIHLRKGPKQLRFSDGGAGEEGLSRQGPVNNRVGALQRRKVTNVERIRNVLVHVGREGVVAHQAAGPILRRKVIEFLGHVYVTGVQAGIRSRDHHIGADLALHLGLPVLRPRAFRVLEGHERPSLAGARHQPQSRAERLVEARSIATHRERIGHG